MKYQIENKRLQVVIDARGAQMCSVQTKDGTEYLWQGDVATWEEHAPTLFPYVGRMWEKKYQYQGQEYTMNIHGFAMENEFVCEKVREDYLLCYMEDTEATRSQYPFAFRFEVHYELIDSVIRVHFIVKNREGKTMYFGLGGHPGFRVPMNSGEKFEEYYMQFPKDAIPGRVSITNTGYVQEGTMSFALEEGNRLTLQHSLFDEDAIVLQDMGNEIQLCGPKGAVLKVNYPKMTYLGLWHWPKTEVPYVCIEPWTSLPSREGVTEDIAEKSDLVRLSAYETYTNVWEIEIL